MKILAFETSCDDTAIAIIENGTKVLAHKKHSQIEHAEYGGVVPEIAARLHSENWYPLLKNILKEANLTIEEIDYLATTYTPGLQTSLLIGTTAASFLSLLYQKPVIPVHHIQGHIASIALERTKSEIEFPLLCLTVSGGHTDFYKCESFTKIQKIGGTIDDATGEAFDKCAKLLGLEYPGGPLVSENAQKGDRKKYTFPEIMLEKESLNFSFSGLKAAVYRIAQSEEKNKENFKANVCASFEETVKNTFLKKLERAILQNPKIKSIAFVGGVSANKYLRDAFENWAKEKQKNFYSTKKMEYSTDNAAMIGAAAYFLYQKDPNIVKGQHIPAIPNKAL